MASLARASLFVIAGASLSVSALAGCSSPESGARMVANTGGSAGASSGAGSSAGGSSGNGSGATGNASSSGGTGGAGDAPPCMILPVQNPMISEFTPPEPVATGGAGGEGGAGEPSTPVTSISFGYDANPPTVASGYSFFYPEATLTSDMSEGVWRISGSVGDYAGFQIAFVCGADASAYQGISFKISGNAGPTGKLSFALAHAADTWQDPNAAEPSAASCRSAMQYDGTCTEASAAIEVGEDEETISLMWADIAGGKPEANPDPAELLALRWLFKWDEAMAADPAAHAYDVDVQLDDVTFIE